LKTIKPTLVSFQYKISVVFDFLYKHKIHATIIYIVRKNLIYLHSLWKRPEKLAKGYLFYLFLKLLQINCIVSNSVHILYIYKDISHIFSKNCLKEFYLWFCHYMFINQTEFVKPDFQLLKRKGKKQKWIFTFRTTLQLEVDINKVSRWDENLHSQTCIKRSLLGERKIGLIRQVTS
jgi:hypothetical protein